MIYGDVKKLLLPFLRVHWIITNLCHNRCWYCITQSSYKEITFSSKESIDKILQKIFSLHYKEFEFVLLGGEPTLHPLFPYILKKLSNEPRVNRIILISTKITKYSFYSNIIPRLTIHPCSNNIPDYMSLLKKRNDVQLRLMLDSTYKVKTYNLYKNIIKVFPNLHLVRLKKPPLFTEYMEFEGISYKNDEKSTFFGKYCLQSTTSILISEKLKVYGANAGCGVQGLTPKIIQCQNYKCGCSGNEHVVKTDSLNEAMNLLEQFKHKVHYD